VRRANVRRVRGASREAKTATPQGDRRTAERGAGRAEARHQARPSKIAQGTADPCARGSRRSRTPPGPSPVCGGKGTVDGCDYWPSTFKFSGGFKGPSHEGLRGRRVSPPLRRPSRARRRSPGPAGLAPLRRRNIFRLPLSGDGKSASRRLKFRASEPPEPSPGDGPSPFSGLSPPGPTGTVIQKSSRVPGGNMYTRAALPAVGRPRVSLSGEEIEGALVRRPRRVKRRRPAGASLRRGLPRAT
jgi:hypothetical protein